MPTVPRGGVDDDQNLSVLWACSVTMSNHDAIASLDRRANHLTERILATKDYPGKQFDLQERAALRVAIEALRIETA